MVALVIVEHFMSPLEESVLNQPEIKPYMISIINGWNQSREVDQLEESRLTREINRNKAHKANDASSWWWTDCMMMWLHEICLVYLPLQLFAQKHWFSLFFYENVTNGPTDGQTDGRTDGPTDGRTDRPCYRDARTHLTVAPSRPKKNALPTDRPTERPTIRTTDILL